MLRLLFSYHGRIGRAGTLLLIPFSIGMALAGAGLWYTQFSDLEGAIEDLGWEALLPTLLNPLPHLIATIAIFCLFVLWCWVASALIVKRLHDRGRRGAWLVLPILAPVLVIALALAPPASGFVAFGEGAVLAGLIAALGWFVRELFWRRASN